MPFLMARRSCVFLDTEAISDPTNAMVFRTIGRRTIIVLKSICDCSFVGRLSSFYLGHNDDVLLRHPFCFDEVLYDGDRKPGGTKSASQYL